MIKIYTITYFASLLAFVVIDGIWLTFIANNFYQKHIGHLLAPQVSFAPAIAFYLAFIGAIMLFCVAPGIEKSSLSWTIFLGLAFGAITYATYDLTNWATLKDWPFIVVAVDILWGAVLSASIATVGYFVWKSLL